jgi:hypothetical protein
MGSSLQERRALVLYGSETGNAQDVAEELGRIAERLRFDTEVAELNAVRLVCQAPNPSAEAAGLTSCRRGTSCTTLWCSFPSPPRARGSYRPTPRHSGRPSEAPVCALDVCTK